MSRQDIEQECAKIRLEILHTAFINGEILSEIYELAIADADMLLGKKDMNKYYSYHRNWVFSRLINIMKSKDWSDTFCRDVRNVPFKENCISSKPVKLDDHIDLEIAINSLSGVHSDNQKKIFRLYFQGYKFTEIASQMGFSQWWVKTLKSYAIKEMRDKLCHTEMLI